MASSPAKISDSAARLMTMVAATVKKLLSPKINEIPKLTSILQRVTAANKLLFAGTVSGPSWRLVMRQKIEKIACILFFLVLVRKLSHKFAGSRTIGAHRLLFWILDGQAECVLRPIWRRYRCN